MQIKVIMKNQVHMISPKKTNKALITDPKGLTDPKLLRASWIAQLVKNLPAMQEISIRFLGQEDPLEKGKATHSSILTWKISWTIQSIGS